MYIHESRRRWALATGRRATLAALTVTIALAPAATRAQGQVVAPAPPPGTVRVVGEATVSAKPDMAELDLGVVSQAPTAGAAAAENARKMDRVVAALKKEVGAGGEVKTASYTVGPRYGDPKPGQDRLPIVGYVVANVVRARTLDVAGVGRLVDAALKLGANEVERIAFGLKDPEPVHGEALKAAALKARAHANALAGAVGLRVRGVVSLSEGDPGPWPMHESAQFRAHGREMKVATPIEAGALEIRAIVTAVFATEPAGR
jgi:uncharacterized protein YggE